MMPTQCCHNQIENYGEISKFFQTHHQNCVMLMVVNTFRKKHFKNHFYGVREENCEFCNWLGKFRKEISGNLKNIYDSPHYTCLFFSLGKDMLSGKIIHAAPFGTVCKGKNLLTP